METVVEANWVSWDIISVMNVLHSDTVLINFHAVSRWFLPFSFLSNIAYVFIDSAILATCSVHHIFVELITFIPDYNIFQYMVYFPSS
jgi:hypothetical protein